MAPTIEQLREALSYDPETGVMIWRHRPLEHFNSTTGMNRSNGRFAGMVAGHPNGIGYLQVCLWGKNYLAHRVVWAIHHGAWPDKCIDHIDGDRSNNRINNLRVVTVRENQRNSKRPSDNRSGVIGVHWSDARRCWLAQIGVHRKTIHLGRFVNIEDAIAARKQAEAEYGFHQNHGRESGYGA